MHMKAPKFLLAGLLALSVPGVARAQTVVHITGSTAFRSAVHTAITQILEPGFVYGYSGTSFTGASQAIFTGTNNGINVIIKTSWSGSLAGIETVSQAVPSTVGTFLTNTTPQSSGGSSGAAANYDPPLIPEVCMSDGFQYSSQYPYPQLTAQTVGVVTFKFMVNSNGYAAGLTNMTPLLAQALWNHGSLPLSLFTGNASQSNILVYAIGRDPDSGTRKTAFLETGIQTFLSTPVTFVNVVQYQPLNANGVVNKANPGAVTSQVFWPAETVDNIPFATGDAGYSSGGDLAWAIRAVSPYIYVTYLGLSDSATAEAGSARELTYNGVAYSDAAVQNGLYTYWTFEQLDYLPSYPTTDANGAAVANALAAQIISTNAAAVGELLSTMNVTRTQEGGRVTPK